MAKDKRPNPKVQAQSPSLSAGWEALKWGAVVWASFIVYKVLSTNPLYIQVFESVLPSQNLFPTASAAAFHVLNAVLGAGLVLGACTAGLRFLRFFNVEWQSPLERAVFAAAVGYGLASFLVLGLAAAHLLYAGVLWAVWAAGVLGFILEVRSAEGRAFFKDVLKGASSSIFGGGTPFVVRFFLWSFLALSCMMAFVPELFYDSLVYHMALPSLYLHEHGLVHVPGATSRFPLLWQTLYAFGPALTDEAVSKFLHWSSMFLVVLAFGSLGIRLGFGWIGTLAALLFISVPMVQMNIWTAGVDVGGCLFAMLTAYSLCAWWQDSQDRSGERPPQTGWLMLASVMAGFTFGSKYQGGILSAAALSAWFVFQMVIGRAEWKAWLKRGFMMAGVLLLTISPWLAKNFWDTGNPLFPFLTPIFQKIGTQNIALDAQQYKEFLGENRRFVTNGWPEHLALPWRLTFDGSNQSSLSYPGPMFLAFGIFGVLAFLNWKKIWFRYLSVFLLIYFAFSLNATHLTRYHLQGYPMLCFLIAVGAGTALRGPVLAKIAVYGCVALLSLSNLQSAIYIINNSYNPWDVLSGRESREAYRMYSHPGLNPYPSNIMFRWMEKNLPADSRTLFIGESKSFDLKLRALYSDVHGKNPLMTWAEKAQSGEDFYKAFQTAGITHLLVNFTEAHRTYGYKMIEWQPDRLQKFEDFWNAHVRAVHEELIPEKLFKSQGEVVLLYEVLPEDQAKAKGPAPVDPLRVLHDMNQKKVNP